MVHINMLYDNQEAFKNTLSTAQFNLDVACLVRIHTAICTKVQAVRIAQEIKEVLPEAQLIGSSGSGVIFEGRQYDHETLVIVEQFAKEKVMVHCHTFQGKNAHDMAREVTNTIKGETVPLMHLLCGEHYYDIHNFVTEFNQQNTRTKLVGGVVGDILPENIPGYVFTEQGVVEQGLITAALCGEGILTYNEANIAHTPISARYSLTKSEGSLLIAVENQPAVSWCREQLGMEGLTEYTDWQLIAENDDLIRFPLILEGHSGASRFLKYDAVAGEMSLYFSQLEDNTHFRLGYTSPIACVQECFAICQNMMKTPIESLFCYTCLFRRLYMGNCAEWELRPFLNEQISGVFMMGELAYINGKNEFLNGACSFVGVADQQVYIRPDLTVFDDLYKIKDDSQKLSSFVLHKQSTTMSKENEKLLKKISQQQNDAKEQLYKDANIGLPNSIKFSQDNQTHQFSKMCMVQIDNSALLMAKLGQAGYYQLMRKILGDIGTYIQGTSYDGRLFYYSLNSSTLFMTATDQVSEIEFMEIVDILYNKYQFIQVKDREELLINRFVVVMHQTDLLTSGIVTLQNSKNLQTHFLISDNSVVDNPDLGQEMKMIHILNDVIEAKRVIPYFQGIYDNEQKVINRYEALMRIQDDQGKIYAPGYFMDIAKKYHMYASLSKLMLEQVFDLFADRQELVSINLSVHDINFDEMQAFIFRELGQMADASNFVFEILEDENLRDMERLKAFITRIRQYGVGIAIDDFGSGYSNFMEIVMIEPDYIKVDASIIKNIDTSTINRKVLENISFLCQKLGAKMVAEGVETEKIQERIAAIEVHFSQGFYFAKPIPFAELGLEP